MGLFDLPAPLLGAIDQLISPLLPAVIRLVFWGVLAGWLTMLIYRRLSNQQRISELKAEQKIQQKIISGFDGEFEQLFPVIRHTLALGLRQLGLSLGPALLATIPIVFIVIWVAGAFGYHQPEAGETVSFETEPGQNAGERLEWSSPILARATKNGWTLTWPPSGQRVSLLQDGRPLFELPFADSVPVIHKRRWWNWLMANPVGYLPDDAVVDSVNIGLPEQQFLAFGPDWMRGWMFSFFVSFLLSSIGFKLALKID
jgi:hypothetical protein